MNFNNVYILQDRSIIYVGGSDSKEFLQNLISNDINRVNEDNSCFASLLTPQGKFLHDFIIVKHKKGFFLDCDKSLSESLFKQLNMYKLRSNIEILDLSNEFVVAALSHEKFLSFDAVKNVAGNTIKFREDPILLDPRDKKLGARLIINLEKLYLSLKKLELKDSDTSEYYYFSHTLGVPQKNMKMLQNNLFGIECNFEELNGIDFKKGCYVGQENTARIKLKNKLSKRLLPITVINGKINEKDVIFYKNEEIGKILINKDYPFGLIKLLGKKLNFDLGYKTNDATIKIIKPEWLNLS